MKTFFRLIALILTAVMPFALFVACNNDDGVTGTEKPSTLATLPSGSSTSVSATQTQGGSENNNSNADINDNVSAQKAAEDAYALYVADARCDAELAKFMIYDASGRIVALKNGEVIGVYANSSSAINALFGDGSAEFCEVEESFVSGLYYCALMDTYSYPLDSLSEPVAAIDSYKDGKFVANGNRYASLISLEGLDYERVTIKNGSKNGTKNSNFAYTFLAEEPVIGQMPVYAKGYSYVIVVEPVQSLTVNIPDDAKYIYLYHHTVSSGKYFFPDELIFSQKAKPANSFTLSTWNIGNFSNGGKYSTITDSQLNDKKALYTDFIENRLDSDLICLNEFDPDFTTSKNYATKDVLFADYVDYVGEKSGYQCNSMFAKEGVSMTEPVAVNYGNGYGYFATEVTIGQKTVSVVSIHLDYDHDYVKGTTDEINKKQIGKILEAFADKERVIFLGDWNCIQFKQYDLLSDAGYTLANTAPDLWTKTGGAIDNHALDNIAYRGVTISNFSCEITDLSDHYALRCTVSVD